MALLSMNKNALYTTGCMEVYIIPALASLDGDIWCLQIEGWMQQAGLRTHIDILGNVRGRVGCRTGAPALLLGSHYDTVWDAGRYDGPLGIIVALAATKALLLQARKVAQQRLVPMAQDTGNAGTRQPVV